MTRLPALAAIALLGLAACGTSEPATVVATPSATPTTAATTAASSPAPAVTTAAALPADITQACTLNQQMQDRSGADLTGEGATITKIANLAGDADLFDIKFAANMLKDRYDLAKAAHGTDMQLSTTLNLYTASINLSTACIKAGWKA